MDYDSFDLMKSSVDSFNIMNLMEPLNRRLILNGRKQMTTDRMEHTPRGELSQLQAWLLHTLLNWQIICQYLWLVHRYLKCQCSLQNGTNNTLEHWARKRFFYFYYDHKINSHVDGILVLKVALDFAIVSSLLNIRLFLKYYSNSIGKLHLRK